MEPAADIASLKEQVTDLNNRLRQQYQLAAIVESAHDAIIGENLNGFVTSWNAGAEALFGYKSAEIIGKAVALLVPADRPDEVPHILEILRRGERVDHFHTVRVTKAGRHLNVSLTISPIKDINGDIIGASKIVRDITEQKLAEAAMLRAKEIAENANRAKDRFLAILSHELRTPLTPVLATAMALQTDIRVPGWMREDVQMIRRNVELEARLIDDLLDLTRIAKGKIDLQQEIVDAHQIIESVCSIIRTDTLGKNVKMDFEFGAAAFHTYADSARLQQVFWNLLKNAIKFTPSGGRVTVRTFNENNHRSFVVEVEDTGVGIAPEAQQRIFDAFEQSERAVTRAFGGLGLGLAITKALVQLHGGTIGVSSAGKGMGAKFTVSLPTVGQTYDLENRPQPPIVESRSEYKMLEILLVEDHPDTARTMVKLLQSLGHNVRSADTVAHALELISKYSFDLLISDIGLPDATGLDLMRQIRTSQPLPGIALSGFGMEDDITRSLDAGFAIHLTKPVNFQKLQSAIQRIALQPTR